MKERRMRLTNLLLSLAMQGIRELQIVPELVGVHAAFVVPSDDRSKFVDLAPGHMKLRSCVEISFTRPDDNVLHTLPTWQK